MEQTLSSFVSPRFILDKTAGRTRDFQWRRYFSFLANRLDIGEDSAIVAKGRSTRTPALTNISRQHSTWKLL